MKKASDYYVFFNPKTMIFEMTENVSEFLVLTFLLNLENFKNSWGHGPGGSASNAAPDIIYCRYYFSIFIPMWLRRMYLQCQK